MPPVYETLRKDLTDTTLPPRPFLAPSVVPPPSSYTPSPVFTPAFNVGVTSAGVGLFVSAIKNSLETHNKGAMGVFTRTGWIAAYFAAAGFTFSAVDHLVANAVESRDNGLAGASGGCAAGFVTGIRTGSVAQAMGMCAFMGTAVGTYDLAGGRLGWENGQRRPRSEREKERESFFKQRKDTQEE